ncbi:MAG TPA: peptidylprolyl isomerase [Chthoniobacteraceae bacterium]|nr:peptidylprolyl isomerase [Chthoniobacteraceae bacterium]
MKSLLLPAVFLSAALATAQAADSSPSPSPSPKSKTGAKASPSPKATAKGSPKASASPSPSATPDKSGLPDPVAIVDGKKIKRSELEAEFSDRLKELGGTVEMLSKDQIQKGYRTVLEDMVIERLLTPRAAKETVTDEEVNKRLQEFKDEQHFTGTDEELNTALKKVGQNLEMFKQKIHDETQKEKWVNEQVADKIKVSDDDAKAFYDANPDQFETVRVSHILISVPKDASDDVVEQKRKAAQAAKDRITKGEDFAKVAGEVSDDADTKGKGGDLVDYLQPGDKLSKTLPEFEDAAFKLKKGEVSDPVETALGWHVIKVTDIKPLPFDQVKQAIIDGLGKEKEEKAINDLLKDLSAKNAKILLPPLAAPPAPDEGAEPPADHGTAPGGAPESMPGGSAPAPAPGGGADTPPMPPKSGDMPGGQ